MTDITRLLEQANIDPKGSLDAVFGLLHAELRALARSRIRGAPRQTLTATALVHELYLKFVGAAHLDVSSRKHFFACSGAAMRQILVDAARAASAGKRGAELDFVTLTDGVGVDSNHELLALDRALDELQQVDPDLLELVNLRFFAGLSMEAVAEIKGCALRGLQRDWAAARAFLGARLAG